MSAALIFAFTAGVAATVNPCGFALLPAWFARQFGQDSGQPLLMRLPRAIGAGASVAAGFVLVFAVAALVLGAAVARLGAVLPYAGVALGVALLAVGLGATTADLAPRLGRVGALAGRGQLRDDDLVHQGDVRAGVEEVTGQRDAAGGLPRRCADVDLAVGARLGR